MYKPLLRSLALLLTLSLLAGCSSNPYKSGPTTYTKSPKKATSKAYKIKGKLYRPQQHYEYDQVGIASHYGDGDGFHGKKTATGEVFNTNSLTAAHKTLPLPCIVRVTNLKNGRAINLKVNDRGPFVKGRIIDVSRKAAQMLGFYRAGITKVRVQTLVPETLALNRHPRRDMTRTLLASARTPPQRRKLVRRKAIRRKPPIPPRRNIMLAAAHSIPVPSTRPGWLALPELNGQIIAMPGQKPIGIAHSTYGEGGIFIQAGTFAGYRNAQSLSNQLQAIANNTPIQLTQVVVNETPMYTVKLGPFSSSEEAEGLLYQIHDAGHHGPKVVYE